METDVLIALLLITVLAALIPILSNRLERFGVPIVVYEIVAGMIIGSSGLDLIETSPILNFLAEFGFAYLMFLSGLELDYRLLNQSPQRLGPGRRWARALPMGILLFLGTLLLAFGAAGLVAPPDLNSDPLLLGLILSTTSLGVVVPVLKERELTGTIFGQYILVAASIADFATLLLLTTVIAVMSRGLTLDLLLIPTLMLIFILVARVSMHASKGGRLQRAINSISSTTSQVRVRSAFALLVAWVVMAEAFGVEVILGAFLAGAIAGLISGDEDHGEQEKLDAIGYGFFIPIFFIMVGARFNLQVVLESTPGLILLAWLVVVAFVVKLVPALLLKVHFTWKQTVAGGMLLSSRLSLIIAASAIALNMGLISELVNSDIILLAIITVTVAPFLFTRFYPKEDKRIRQGIIVVGQDQLAEYIIERLLHGDETVTIICPDQSRIEHFRKLSVEIVDRCLDYETALREAGGDTARVLLDLTISSEEAVEVCGLGKEKFDIPLVVSRIADVELIPSLQKIGAKIVQPELATAMALEGAIRYPTAFDLLVHQTENIDVTEISVTNPEFEDIRLAEIRFPGDTLVLSLQRDGIVMVPHGDTVLRLHDRIGLIGSPSNIEEASSLLRG